MAGLHRQAGGGFAVQHTDFAPYRQPTRCRRSEAMTEASPWWAPEVHADRRPFLLARGRITDAVRGWFRAHDFVEVETAILQPSPGNETHLHAFATELRDPGGAHAPLYLHTSPEFACKRLLAAGEQRIFT